VLPSPRLSAGARNDYGVTGRTLTFARRVYEASGHDLIRTQRALGHSSPVTTARYLETDADALDRLILDIAA